ncbi:MOSC domain-containing protein [Isoptericola variabilis]|uniref:MOSC domain containing protein n=1 Tax=Isoptericola variabilis (strain 225) TaxID=743718 RepID=F6FUX9_ISOV2|nr:MOSC N-terminal beta barrel domain-containing protein [Isoptericola variabilis]AEG44319.1 MOSC domain containing protein [Isoptericola variabilis 225]TWH31093.1 hypothetical protein L600_002600000330 [Isoptericola variabilis J7]
MTTVSALRRYPVKAMGGEPLDVATLDARGVTGDRWYAVRDADGRFASLKDTRRFRRRDGVVAYTAATASDGSVRVTHADGTWTVGDPALDAHLGAALGVPVTVAPEGDVAHHDDGRVSLVGTASLAWCARRFGGSGDPRRLRANVVLDTDEPFVEEGWVGRELRVGTAVLRVVGRVERCRTVDVAQDGAEPGAPWLRPLGAERDLCLAVYADVVEPGTVARGDALRLA